MTPALSNYFYVRFYCDIFFISTVQYFLFDLLIKNNEHSLYPIHL